MKSFRNDKCNGIFKDNAGANSCLHSSNEILKAKFNFLQANNAIKILFYVLLINISLYAVESPTLLKVTPLSGTSTQLIFRANDLETTAFIIYRHISADTQWQMIAEIKSTYQEYKDSDLKPMTKYFYCLKSLTATDTSVFSDIVSVVTMGGAFRKPVFTIDQYFPKIRFNLENDIGTGVTYRIYRADTLQKYAMIKLIESNDYDENRNILWVDSAMKLNSWYWYYISAQLGDSIKETSKILLRQINYDDLVNEQDTLIKINKRLSGIPFTGGRGWKTVVDSLVFYAYSYYWDTLVNVIDVSNPEKPRYSYTLTNKYKNCYDVFAFKNNLYTFQKDNAKAGYSIMKRYAINKAGITIIDSMSISDKKSQVIDNIDNDSIVLIQGSGETAKIFDLRSNNFLYSPWLDYSLASANCRIFGSILYTPRTICDYIHGYTVQIPNNSVLDMSKIPYPIGHYKLMNPSSMIDFSYKSILYEKNLYIFYSDSLVIYSTDLVPATSAVGFNKTLRSKCSLGKCNNTLRVFDLQGRLIGNFDGKRNAYNYHSLNIFVLPDGKAVKMINGKLTKNTSMKHTAP